jgi:hypothetical protein
VSAHEVAMTLRNEREILGWNCEVRYQTKVTKGSIFWRSLKAFKIYAATTSWNMSEMIKTLPTKNKAKQDASFGVAVSKHVFDFRCCTPLTLWPELEITKKSWVTWRFSPNTLHVTGKSSTSEQKATGGKQKQPPST